MPTPQNPISIEDAAQITVENLAENFTPRQLRAIIGLMAIYEHSPALAEDVLERAKNCPNR